MRLRFGLGLRVTSGVAALLIGTAAAGTLKPGLWSFTMTMDRASMPQIPPEALARMKAMGMSMPAGGGMTAQHCVTPEEAARDAPQVTRAGSGCAMGEMSRNGNVVTYSMVCSGQMQGIAKAAMTVAPEHFSGDYSFTGTENGRPVNTQSHIDAQYLAADCGSAP